MWEPSNITSSTSFFCKTNIKLLRLTNGNLGLPFAFRMQKNAKASAAAADTLSLSLKFFKIFATNYLKKAINNCY